MHHNRSIRVLAGGALLLGGAACGSSNPPAKSPDVFEAAVAPEAGAAEWSRVDPDLRASSLRLSSEVAGTISTRAPLEDVDRSLDFLANALDRLPAGTDGPLAAASARYIHARARAVRIEAPDDATRRALIQDALDTAAMAFATIGANSYGGDAGIADAVGRFQEKVGEIQATSANGRLDVYEALLAARNTVEAFERAIAKGSAPAR